MPKRKNPRHGSMQFWPRKRAQKETPRVRSKVVSGTLSEFAGYKVGMTHAIVVDTKAKGQDVFMPLTIIECPPIQVIGIRYYQKKPVVRAVGQVFSDKLDKELGRKISVPKKKSTAPKEFDDITLLVATQPKMTSLAKKKPEIFEVALGGSTEEKVTFAQEKIGKQLMISDIFKVGDFTDMHAVTTGKGYQGPVKRFGVSLRHHKSEKTVRGPGSLGPWKGQGHVMYRIAFAGQTGYHLRTEYNKQIVKIIDKPEEINTSSGYKRYGVIKNQCVLVQGSIQGPAKRLIRIMPARRNHEKRDAPEITFIKK